MPKIFISYRRADTQPRAEVLHKILSDRFGEGNVFTDLYDIPLGTRFPDVLRTQLSLCDAAVVLIGKQWLTVASEDGGRRLDDPLDFVRMEIKELLGRGIHIVPVMVNGAMMPRVTDLPDEINKLADCNGMHLPNGGIFEEEAMRLVPLMEALLPARVVGLPLQDTSFVGREREIGEIVERLRGDEGRILTLIGPGGTGKTRLAEQVAVRVVDVFPDGVFYVQLDALEESTLVLPTIAAVLQVKESGPDSVREALKTWIDGRKLLLILDNFEHVLPAALDVMDLMRTCRGLRVLVTSRALLSVGEERPYPVTSMAAPDPHHLAGAHAALSYDAIALFETRARAIRSEFRVGEDNARIVADICAALDGLPLAIELAVARLGSMALEELQSRLVNRLAILTGRTTDPPSRHGTMRATIKWSYDLLPPPEQTLFNQFSVFSGSCSLTAAEQICSAQKAQPLMVLDGLRTLVESSLITQEILGIGESRHRMLQMVREYAREQLQTETSDETLEQLQKRHATFFLDLVERAQSELRGPDQMVWLQRLELDIDNIRSALEWAGASGRTEMRLRMAGALARFWDVRGHLTEGRQAIDTALAQADDVPLTIRAAALLGSGDLAWRQGDYPGAEQRLGESLRLYQEVQDTGGIAAALSSLGSVSSTQGKYEEAGKQLQESLSIRESEGDRRGMGAVKGKLGVLASTQGAYDDARKLTDESLALRRETGDIYGIASALSSLGIIDLAQERYTEAQERLRESADMRQKLGDRRGAAGALGNLGIVAIRLGRHGEARSLLTDSLESHRDAGDKLGICERLESVAWLVGVRGDFAQATRLLGAANRLRTSLAAPRARYLEELSTRYTALIRGQMNDAEWEVAWQKGERMTLEEAIAMALMTRPVGSQAREGGPR